MIRKLILKSPRFVPFGANLRQAKMNRKLDLKSLRFVPFGPNPAELEATSEILATR